MQLSIFNMIRKLAIVIATAVFSSVTISVIFAAIHLALFLITGLLLVAYFDARDLNWDAAYRGNLLLLAFITLLPISIWQARLAWRRIRQWLSERYEFFRIGQPAVSLELVLLIGVPLAFLTAGLMLMASFFSGMVSIDEVARVASPSGDIEAVLLETNGGATTSFGYQVFVVERGAKPSGSAAVFLYDAGRNQHAYGANLKWLSPHTLVVEYLSAKTAKVNKQTQSIGDQTIQFVLRDGVTDDTAPAGGMLYNLRRRQ